jgi:glycosyltransferase involved in cell wall biosynthesis
MSNPIIIYLTPYDILRPRTNQVGDVRLCEGFAQNNCEVNLLVPFVERADNISKDDVAKFYGLDKTYSINYLPYKFNKEVVGWSILKIAFLDLWESIKIINKAKKDQRIYIISRTNYLLRPFFILRKIIPGFFKQARIIHWSHEIKLKKSYLHVYKNTDSLLATNSAIIEDLNKDLGFDKTKAFPTLNPISEAQASECINKEQAKKEVNLLEHQNPLIVYTGKVGILGMKEIEHILEAAQLLPNYTFLLTGGKPEAVEHWKKWCAERNISNYIFTGYIYDYTQIKNYQYAADVLVSYYVKSAHDVRYNFPNKICEYMLTGNVIITPDYPATRDVLTENNCYYVEPENSIALAEKIKYAIEHKEESLERGKKAKQDVREITFKNRTGLVLDFLNKQP